MRVKLYAAWPCFSACLRSAGVEVGANRPTNGAPRANVNVDNKSQTKHGTFIDVFFDFLAKYAGRQNSEDGTRRVRRSQTKHEPRICRGMLDRQLPGRNRE